MLEMFSIDIGFILYNNNNHPCSYFMKKERNCGYNEIFNLLIEELKISETNQFFANLTKFVFTGKERKNSIFFSLSQICHNIQKLIIGIAYPWELCEQAMSAPESAILKESKLLASLIRSQNNLIYFELFGGNEESASEILKSLKET